MKIPSTQQLGWINPAEPVLWIFVHLACLSIPCKKNISYIFYLKVTATNICFDGTVSGNIG